MKGLYLRNNVWWFRFTPTTGAAQARVSLGTADEAEAIRLAREYRETAREEAREAMASFDFEVGLYVAALKTKGLSKNTVELARTAMRSLQRTTEAQRPHEVTRAQAQAWFDARWAHKQSTALLYLATAKRFFQWLKGKGKLSTNVLAQLQVPKRGQVKGRKRFLRVHEARLLLDSCESERLKFALYCALHAGMRKLEIVEAVPAWFDLEAGLIHISATDTFTTKDRDNRTVPMTDEFRAWLRGYGLRSPFMLAPDVEHGKTRYRFDFYNGFRGLARRCGFHDLTFHDLRRTFASLLVSQGVSLYKVAQWLGDTLAVAEDTYGHLVPQDAEINAAWLQGSRAN